jgi:peptidoglycan/LPS O-acetylase OafA/YrhL
VAYTGRSLTPTKMSKSSGFGYDDGFGQSLYIFFVLPVAYLAVNWSRSQPFDWRYLLFIQNYETQIPFFLVSWSLCVEEHFYLFLPIILITLTNMGIRPFFFLPVLALTSIAIRLIDPLASPGNSFGYSETATHIRFDGLTIGVWLAYIKINKMLLWPKMKIISRNLVVPMIVGYLTIPSWSQYFIYYFSYAYMTLTWSVLIVTLVSTPTLELSKFWIVKSMALWSYSIYLTHSLVIHSCVILTDRLNFDRNLTFPIWMLLILLIGFVIYRLVEVPSISFRDHVVPRRIINVGPALNKN